MKKPSDAVLLRLAAETRNGVVGSIGERFKVARLMAGKTAQELGEALADPDDPNDTGLSIPRISQIEKEGVQEDSDILRRAAEVLDVDHRWLAYGQGDEITGGEFPPPSDAKILGAPYFSGRYDWKIRSLLESIKRPQVPVKIRFYRKIEWGHLKAHYIAPTWLRPYWDRISQVERNNGIDKNDIDATLVFQRLDSPRMDHKNMVWIRVPGRLLEEIVDLWPPLLEQITNPNPIEMEPRRRQTSRRSKV